MHEAPRHWVHDLSPFLIQFSENWGIRYYGLSYLMGFALGGWILYRMAVTRRLALEPAAVADMMTALVIGVMAGGRLGYYALYEPATWWHDPLQIFRVWEGGMASHGGFVGVVLAMVWFARRHRMRFLPLTDAVTAVAPLGIGLGRVANFINGELPGRITTVPWAVIFPSSAPPGTAVAEIAPRHPSQLYAAMLEGFLIFAYLQARYWLTAKPLAPGRISGEFLVVYACARGFCEAFREPDASLILGLTRGTFYSIFMLIAGVILIRRSRRVA